MYRYDSCLGGFQALQFLVAPVDEQLALQRVPSTVSGIVASCLKYKAYKICTDFLLSHVT